MPMPAATPTPKRPSLPRRLVFPLLLALVAASLAGAVTANQHGGPGGPPDGPPGQGPGQGQGPGGAPGNGTPPERAQAMRERAMERAADARLFSQFAYDDETGTASGRFVVFDLEAQNGTIRDYRLRSPAGAERPVLASVTPSAFAGSGDVVVQGSVLRVNATAQNLSAHNNPLGLLRYGGFGAGTRIAFELAEGFSATLSRTNRSVQLEDGNVSATILLLGQGTLEANGTTVSATFQGTNATSGILFRAHPMVATAAQRERAEALREAAEAGRFGASVRLAGANGTAAQERLEFDVRARALAAGNGTATVEVSSDQEEGRVIEIVVDRGTLPARTPSQLTARFDGAAMQRVGSIAALVGADAETPAAYHVLVTPAALEVTVWVPNWSTHTIDLESDDEGGTGAPGGPDGDDGGDEAGAPAPAVALLLVAALSLAALLRRRAPRS